MIDCSLKFELLESESRVGETEKQVLQSKVIAFSLDVRTTRE